ncbi:helix-turn-helix domain-containing protein [Endozoicomonas sp. SESOKO1]|uniref:MarR family transcriptional regulator n=1 Tax=Endozoicomonas sp. SESOKO1 TaxID=2828742 RepID=UPI0021497CC2|nr:MarR family transcriptional regulator [Endozoicomonas sp. SESOKO1]
MSKGLGKQQLAILEAMEYSEYPQVTVYALTEVVNRSQQAVHRALQNLVTRGYVVKTQRKQEGLSIGEPAKRVFTYTLVSRLEEELLADHTEALSINAGVEKHGSLEAYLEVEKEERWKGFSAALGRTFG